MELMASEAGPVARPQTVNIEDLFRYAIEKGGGVDTMERLMAVRRELNAEQAKRAFDDAMAAFQAECPVIGKNKRVEGLYDYAPFEDIIAAVKPLLGKHRLSFKLDTDIESKDGWVIGICRVKHLDGHSEESKLKLPISPGTRAMDATKCAASALTFVSRRVFCCAFGIVTGGEDKDGHGAKDKPKGPSSQRDDKGSKLDGKQLKSDLWDLLKPVRGLEHNWNQAQQWLADECGVDDMVGGMSPARLAEIIVRVEAKLNGGGK